MSKEVLDNLKKAAKEFQKQEEELADLRTAMIKATRGYSKLSWDGVYVEVNDAYAGILEGKPEDLLGGTWQKTVHPDDIDKVVEAWNQMAESGQGEACVRGLKLDGTVFKKIVTIVRLNGGGHFFYCFMLDVTKYFNND